MSPNSGGIQSDGRKAAATSATGSDKMLFVLNAIPWEIVQHSTRSVVQRERHNEPLSDSTSIREVQSFSSRILSIQSESYILFGLIKRSQKLTKNSSMISDQSWKANNHDVGEHRYFLRSTRNDRVSRDHNPKQVDLLLDRNSCILPRVNPRCHSLRGYRQPWLFCNTGVTDSCWVMLSFPT